VSSDDRRQEDNRYAVKLPAYVHIGPEHTLYRGSVMNLSASGVFVTTRDKVELGPNVYLNFSPSEGVVCEASGTVVHSMGFGNGVGFGAHLDRTTPSYLDFLSSLSHASQVDIMTYMRFIKRIKVWVW
jgi:hypothetical protein